MPKVCSWTILLCILQQEYDLPGCHDAAMSLLPRNPSIDPPMSKIVTAEVPLKLNCCLRMELTIGAVRNMFDGYITPHGCLSGLQRFTLEFTGWRWIYCVDKETFSDDIAKVLMSTFRHQLDVYILKR